MERGNKLIVVSLIMIQATVILYFAINHMYRQTEKHVQLLDNVVAQKLQVYDANFALIGKYLNADNPQLLQKLLSQGATNESNEVKGSGDKEVDKPVNSTASGEKEKGSK